VGGIHEQILQSNRETRDAVLAALRSEMEAQGGSLRGEIAELRGELFKIDRRCHDARHVMVQLAEAGGIAGVCIAECFQVTPV